jgi:4-hydroxybenzoyl-CoA thioesterase
MDGWRFLSVNPGCVARPGPGRQNGAGRARAGQIVRVTYKKGGARVTASYPFRVAWFDCDPAGIIFYPRVLAYMNEAAHGLLEQAGFPLEKLAERNVIGVPMVSLSVNYLKVLKLGDHADIESEVTEIGRSSIKIRHRVMRGGEQTAEANEVRVYARRNENGDIEAAPVDDDVRAALLTR